MKISNIAICNYAHNHVSTRYTCRQKLNDKETANTTTVTITKRSALTIEAPAVVMTAAAIAVALLGLHIQALCPQFVYVILNF